MLFQGGKRQTNICKDKQVRYVFMDKYELEELARNNVLLFLGFGTIKMKLNSGNLAC